MLRDPPLPTPVLVSESRPEVMGRICYLGPATVTVITQEKSVPIPVEKERVSHGVSQGSVLHPAVITGREGEVGMKMGTRQTVVQTQTELGMTGLELRKFSEMHLKPELF